MKCKTCKFWNANNSHLYIGLGICDKIQEFNIATIEDSKGDRRFKSSFENEKAFTQDYESYMSFLLTKPDFGCVMYEEK